MAQYLGVECDSDAELYDSDQSETYSDDGAKRKNIDYDIEKMFEIVKKRDFNKWSMDTIHHKYKKVCVGEAGRKQMSR